MTATAPQISAIHVLAKKAGMDEDMRRDFLQREAGVRSSKLLTVASAGAVIEKLKAQTDGVRANGAVAGLESPAARKLRALWIAGYDLGLVRDRSDRAMLSFLERQSGVSHTRFLKEPGQATSAIEGLKSWLKRDGKVEWPAREAWKRDGKADFDEIAASKQAIVEAQWRKLTELGLAAGTKDAPFAGLGEFAIATTGLIRAQFELTHYDQVQKALGRLLRDAIAKAARQ
jgi:phage gp16-like protein